MDLPEESDMSTIAGSSQPAANTLLHSALIKETDDTRTLIFKRCLALDAWGADEKTVKKIAEEMQALGWSTDLATLAERRRPSKPNQDLWPERGLRAILCLKLHTQLGREMIWDNFFWTRGTKFGVMSNKWYEIMTKRIAGWDDSKSDALRNLYIRSHFTFDTTSSNGTFDRPDRKFSAQDLEIVYAKAMKDLERSASSQTTAAGEATQTLDDELDDEENEENKDMDMEGANLNANADAEY